MKINTAVLFGGKSVEHEISIISALQAIDSISREKYNPIPVYITKDNELYSGPALENIDEYSDIPALLKKSFRVAFAVWDNRPILFRPDGKKLYKQKRVNIEVALPIVHGVNVEDGTLQGFLQMLNLPYGGCDVCASAIGMNKYVSKQLFKQCGLPVLDCEPLDSHDYYADTDASLARVEAAISYPMIIKPINLGSSIGISMAKARDSLRDALELAFTFADSVIIEPAITNIKEVNCSVLGDSVSPRASECEEPVNSDEILSYADKYLSGGAKKTQAGSKGMQSLQRKLPAEISDEMKARIQDTAIKAFKAIGGCGVARIDFIIDTSTNDVWLNEINTIPGSLSFYLWEFSGMSYAELLNELLSLALKRERGRNKLTYSFETNVLQRGAISGSKNKSGR